MANQSLAVWTAEMEVLETAAMHLSRAEHCEYLAGMEWRDCNGLCEIIFGCGSLLNGGKRFLYGPKLSGYAGQYYVTVRVWFSRIKITYRLSIYPCLCIMLEWTTLVLLTSESEWSAIAGIFIILIIHRSYFSYINNLIIVCFRAVCNDVYYVI